MRIHAHLVKDILVDVHVHVCMYVYRLFAHLHQVPALEMTRFALYVRADPLRTSMAVQGRGRVQHQDRHR